MTGSPPSGPDLEAIIANIQGKTPQATERARAELRATLEAAQLPPLERYRNQVAALTPEQRIGRRLAFANMIIVIASLLTTISPQLVNTGLAIARGGTPLPEECLAEHSRRYCNFLMSRDVGPLDLHGWVLIPFALAAVVLLVLVWPARRHYAAVRPARPVVIIIANPLSFGVFSLLLAAFAAVGTWRYEATWESWAAQFVPPVTIWVAAGLVGVGAGIVQSRRSRPARTKRRR
jgi:hypothetical protein